MDGVSGTSSIQTGDTGVRTFALTADELHVAIVDLKGKVIIVALTHLTHPMGQTRIYSSNDVVQTYNHCVSASVAMQTSASVPAGCKVSWTSVSGRPVLAIPAPSGSCTLCIATDSGKWEDRSLANSLEGPLSHGNSDVNLAVFSPQGTHLATAATDGSILIWELNHAQLVQSRPVKRFSARTVNPLFDLVWGPLDGDNYLLASTRNGFVRIDDVIDAPVPVAVIPSIAHSSSVEMDAVSISATPVEQSIPMPTVPKKRLTKANESAAANDSDDDAFAATQASSVVPATADSETNNESIAKIKQQSGLMKRNVNKLADEEEEDMIEENGDIESEWAQNNGGGLAELDARIHTLESAKSDSLLPVQAPFQPASTTKDDKQRRYLVWNHIGNITLREEPEANQNRIEIRFADTMGRNKQEAFADTDGFVMAALSNEGALFATPMEVLEEDAFRKPLGSKIHYHAFPAQPQLEGANETFTIDLPENEEATNVAVGRGWSAVATSTGLLRIFSSTGVQLHVFWLKGPVVTLVGSATQLAIFYNAAQPMCGTVQIKMDLYALFWDRPMVSRCVASELAVPLTRGSHLSWAGFETDTRCVSIVDSAGMLSVLLTPMGWQWTPVLDIEKAKRDPSHSWWPVTVKRDKLAYVLLNGESKPVIYPQPVVATKPLRVPIAEIKEGRDKGESANQRSHDLVLVQALTAHAEHLKTEEDVFGLWSVEDDMAPEALAARLEKQQIEADKTVLKMFQEACRVQQIAKALDLARKLRTDKALQAGTQIANKFGRPAVAAKLDELLEARFAQQQQQQREQESQQEQPEGPVNSRSHASTQPSEYDSQKGIGAQIYQDSLENVLPVTHTLGPDVGPVAVTPAENRPQNPFKKAAHSPIKRKAGEYDMDDLQKMKSSPSPAKKPLLSRQSSFTENARSQRLGTSSFL